MNRVVLSAILVYISLGCFAQINYQENLIEAIRSYDKGDFNQALLVSETCTHSTNTNEIWQAYRVMSLCYLGLNQNDSAKAYAVKMLNINPDYRASRNTDPADFIKLLSTITVIPKWSWGMVFSLGSNLSIPKINESYVLGDFQKKYSLKFGTQFSTHTDFFISPHSLISVNLGVLVKKLDVQYSLPNWQISAKENLTYLQMPLLYQYIFNPTKKIRYFAQVGPNFGRLIYDKMSFVANSTQFESQTLQKVDVINRRNLWNVGLMAGGGLYVSTKVGYLNIQANYIKSFDEINKPKSRFENIEQMYTYYYLDDDVSIDNVVISIGLAKIMSYKVYRKKHHE